MDLKKINVFAISPSHSPCTSSSKYIRKYEKSKETIAVNDQFTSKGSFLGSDSCISFVMRSPIFKGNVDTVEEIQLTNGFCKSLHDSAGSKSSIIKRNNTHFNTIMSKMSNNNIDLPPQSPNKI